MTNHVSNDHAHADAETEKAKIGIIKGIDQITMREVLQKHREM